MDPHMSHQKSIALLDPVIRQLERFNAHDAEGFASCFTSDARFEQLTGPPVAVGRTEIVQVYTQLFARVPNLRMELIGRMIRDNYVVDHELGEGDSTRGPDGRFETIVAYRVAGDCIDRVWFIR
ncbi:hypothetical protein SmB9_01110 [Sphingosinicella microcystinivorans]|uniref:SnoaL-like domain-containing protein n=2 Tax=Sphingosinicella microcystinivorans TaxID=335406 RepID=A0AAD1D2B7_SPHMI|nr:hypothetical protein SmB9_01110 [Sphingosinicella microcystinivorans]